jgi:hypothetical protein
MKIAICIIGHIRNFVHNYPSLKKHLLDKYDCDVFCSTWDTLGWRVEGNQITTEQGGFKGFDYYSNAPDFNQVFSLLKPKAFIIDDYKSVEALIVRKSEGYKTRLRVPHDRPENTVSQAYKFLQIRDAVKAVENANQFKYDRVIRTRFDIYYENDPLEKCFDEQFIYTPLLESYDLASDIFAVARSEDMYRYLSLLESLDDIFKAGCLMNGHNIIKHHLDTQFPSCWYKLPLPILLNRHVI